MWLASSKCSVSQGTVQKTARQKIKKSVARGSESVLLLPPAALFLFFCVLFSVLHPDQLNEEAIPFIIMLTVIDDINSAE